MPEVLDIERILGTSGFVPAMKEFPLAQDEAPQVFTLPAAYDVPKYVVDPAGGAMGSTVVAPTVWSAQLVAPALADYYGESVQRMRRYVAEGLADSWEEANVAKSTMRSAARHSSYARLRHLGTASIELALRRLYGRQRPLWLFFLRSAVSDRPAVTSETVDQAARAWLKWGRDHGHLP